MSVLYGDYKKADRFIERNVDPAISGLMNKIKSAKLTKAERAYVGVNMLSAIMAIASALAYLADPEARGIDPVDVARGLCDGIIEDLVPSQPVKPYKMQYDA